MTDRAVSTTLNYVLSLGIATLLITGLLLAGGTFVDDRRENVVRSELTVVGQQIAADLARADRLVTASAGPTDVRVEQSLPERITGVLYRVSLHESPDQRLVLNTTEVEVSVAVNVTTRTPLEDSRAEGGDLSIVYDESGGHLEVRDG